MGKFLLSSKAKNDIDNIWEYTFNKWSLSQADKYFNGLQNKFSEISKNPYSGRNYEFLGEEYFGVKFNSHIIFYKVINLGEISILRILHEKMDFPNRMLEWQFLYISIDIKKY